MKDEEIVEARGKHGRIEKYIQGFGGETWR